MMSWPLSDSEPIAGRLTLRLSVSTFVLATAWIVLAMLISHLIRCAYRGESLSLFNHLIAGRAEHPLDEYLARWNVLAWSGLGAIFSAGAFLIVATRPRPLWLVEFGPPVCAFLLVRALLWVSFAAAPAHEVLSHHRWDGTPARFATSFNLDSWSRWDSGVYLSIARAGYEFYPCDIPSEGAPISRQGGRAGTESWCGNCPWFPGYSILVWFLARFRLPELAGGVLLSAVFCLLTLSLLWREFLSAERTVKNFLCLLFASVFPGAVYYHAVFPISMMTFLILVSLHFARRKRWAFCGLAGAAAAFTYPPGALLAIVFAAWVFYLFRDVRWRDKLWWTGTVGVLTTAGVALVFIVQRLFVGAWLTFLTAQGAYKEGSFGNPVTILFHSARDLLTDWGHPGTAVIAANTLFNATLVVLLVAFAARAARRSPVEAYQVIFLLTFWVALLSLGEWSQTRKQALLLPAVPLARHLPSWVLWVIVPLSLLLMLLEGTMFFNASLM